MLRITLTRIFAVCVIALVSPITILAETVGVFFDPAVAQIKFAAGDVKAALERPKFSVEFLPLTSLTPAYPHKTHLKAGDSEKAKTSLGTADCWWMKYSSPMDSMYFGMTMARSIDLPDWHAHDKSVLKASADLGGTETPSCEENSTK
jgi:hypothetical protein